MAAAESRLQELIPNFRKVRGTKLFRSAHLDKLKNGSNISLLGKLNVKLILDLRTESELPATAVLDSYYERISHQSRSDGKLERRDPVDNYIGKRINRPILGKNYQKCLRKKLPFLWQMIFLVLSVIDKLLGTTYGYKIILNRVLNKEGVTQQYLDIIWTSGDEIVKVLELFSNPDNVPALICCAWGKDRTGILCALLQDLCGVDRDIIIEDYTKSEKLLENRALGKEMMDLLKRYGIHSRYAEAKRESMETMCEFLVAEYGSVAEYLQLHGLTKATINKIIENVKVQP